MEVNDRITALILAVALVLSACVRGAETEVGHLAQVLDLRASSSVVDVGAGSGELSIAIAEYVGPQGVVYSTEIDQNCSTESGVRHKRRGRGI